MKEVSNMEEDIKNPEELLPNEPESFEVTELDDKDMEGVAGGLDEILAEPSNTNCGCHGNSFEGVAGASNSNCGC
jgi:hypothetical protein